MKLIPLTQGQFAQVDDEDYEYLMQWKWNAHKLNKTHFYASRTSKKDFNGKRSDILMHRILIKAEKHQFVDHKNRNPLDNRKSNLRFATPRQNAANIISAKNSTSKYLGVHILKCKGILATGKPYLNKYWVARCRSASPKTFVFPFTPEGEILAAKKYDELAKSAHAEFANLNFNDLQ